MTRVWVVMTGAHPDWEPGGDNVEALYTSEASAFAHVEQWARERGVDAPVKQDDTWLARDDYEYCDAKEYEIKA